MNKRFSNHGFIVPLLLGSVLVIGLVAGTLYVTYKDQSLITRFLPSSVNPQKQSDKVIVGGKTVSELKVIGETRFNTLWKTIVAAFPQSQYPEINNEIAKVKLAQTLPDQYKIYQTAFSEMKTFYSKTKDQKMKTALSDLKDYVSVYPNYNGKDFVLPK